MRLHLFSTLAVGLLLSGLAMPAWSQCIGGYCNGQGAVVYGTPLTQYNAYPTTTYAPRMEANPIPGGKLITELQAYKTTVTPVQTPNPIPGGQPLTSYQTNNGYGTVQTPVLLYGQSGYSQSNGFNAEGANTQVQTTPMFYGGYSNQLSVPNGQ